MGKLEISEEELTAMLANNPQVTLDGETSSPKTVQTSQTPNLPHTGIFNVSQGEYIEYLIDKRIKEENRAKKVIFWQYLTEIAIFIMKLILAALIFCIIVYGFYFVVWLSQNSINQHWLDQIATP